MASDRTYAVGMSGASYTGLWSVQKSEVGKYMLSSRALPQSSGGAFVMNITPRYELVRRDPLGEGSYGSVWLCQERDVCAAATESAGDKVANAGRPQAPAANRQKPRLVVKCVAYMSNGEECRRMLREVCLMSTMNHPHVSSAVDAWTWKPPGVQPLQLCVVSPFGGCSLAAFLCKFNSANPLPEETARSIMQQLAAATCYLHSVAIIHRDIKSENVLVEEKPNGQVTVRLIDFGLARVLAPMQASPVADAAETSDQVPSKSSAESGVEDDGEHDNEEEEEGEGEGDDEDEDPLDAMLKRDRAAERMRMGFSDSQSSQSPSANKAANSDTKRRRVTIREPDVRLPQRLDSGTRAKRAQMTRHVVTHWYRPPELFVNSNRNADYDATVDVWSLGCIFAEIVYRVHPPLAKSSHHKWSGVLFCQQEDVGKFLNDVMSLCGRPCAADVDAMSCKLNARDADVLRELVAAASNCRDTIDEHAVFSKMPQLARDLLRKALQFNPRNRLSAEQFYCHPYLGGTATQLVEMAGGSAQVSATRHENLSLKLEEEPLERSIMEALLTQACLRLQQRRQGEGQA
jgi:serine/threonine protein kinase